jgi:drug/metabolite transporter (DMT)-like permease
MQRGNFVIAVTYSKTEVLQVAGLGALVLHELPTAAALVAMTVAVAGVVLLAIPRMQFGAPAGWRGLGPAAWCGLGAGAAFAVAVISYRAAGLEFMRTGPYSVWYAGGWTILLAQALQSAVICGWMAWRSRPQLLLVFSSWRISAIAGLAGAVASITGVTAYILRPAADVRALSMVEVVLSYLVSRRLMRERISPLEQAGLILVMAGVAGVCLDAR